MKLLGVITTVLLVFPHSVTQAQSPNEFSSKMKVLKSQMDVLDSQRDLVVINFPLVEAVSEDMLTIAKQVSGNATPHASIIEGLKTDLETLLQEARDRDSNAYVTANSLQNTCLVCHSNVMPASGVTWEALPGLNWSGLAEKCNSDSIHGTNPYTCKNMYGMKTMINYFSSSHAADSKSYKATAEVANEIHRIASRLVKNNFIHGGKKMLKNLDHEAVTIEVLAKRLDPRAFEKSKSITNSCTQCHSL